MGAALEKCFPPSPDDSTATKGGAAANGRKGDASATESNVTRGSHGHSANGSETTSGGGISESDTAQHNAVASHAKSSSANTGTAGATPAPGAGKGSPADKAGKIDASSGKASVKPNGRAAPGKSPSKPAAQRAQGKQALSMSQGKKALAKGAHAVASAMTGAASASAGILSRRSGGSRQPGRRTSAGEHHDEIEGDDLLLGANSLAKPGAKGGTNGASQSAQARANRAAKAKQAIAKAQNGSGGSAPGGGGAIAVNRGTPSAYQQQQAAAYMALMEANGGIGRQSGESKPAWNSSPMRHAPAALRGLKPVTPEPWASDEAIYDRLYNSQSRSAESGFGANDRHLNKTARKKEAEYRHTDYMARFDQKYAELNGTIDKYDGNPFT